MKGNKIKPVLLSNNSSKFLSSPSYIPTLALFLVIILQHQLTTAVTLGNETDHIALLAIKSNLVDHSPGVLSSWNHSVHHCDWEGVTCGRRHSRVTFIDLSSRSLSGTISPFVGNISFLRRLWLYNNSLHGNIPLEVGRLFRLRVLNLSNNVIVGQIPANLSGCIKLQSFIADYNKLNGKLPRGLGALSNLKNFSVDSNNFTGPLFEVIGNLTSLLEINVRYNAFTGTIHDSIDKMRNLTALYLGHNKLSGVLPPSIFNLSSLQELQLTRNQLQGILPPDIAFTLPRLQLLHLSFNFFSGPVPISIQNLTILTMFSIAFNNFTGLVPVDFGRLQNLRYLLLYSNNLGGDLKFIDTLVNCSNLKSLHLGANDFTGAIPKSLVNLSTTLEELNLQMAQLSGGIPVGITNLINLRALSVAINEFTGTIPRDIGKLQHLERVYFNSNSFTGGIPNTLGNLSHLTHLYLDANNLQGSIPLTLGNCKNVLYLYLSLNDLNGTLPSELFQGSTNVVEADLSNNRIEGSLPLEISKQIDLVRLDVSANKFSGEIPDGLGNCRSLQYLHMEGNSFDGNIPPTFNSLGSLEEVDLSNNNISGSIPQYFSKFPLVYLNLSFNNFEGKVPTDGVFANASAISLIGNTNLCGGIPGLYLPRCMEKENKKRRMTHALKLAIPIICALVGVAMAVWLCFTCHRKKRKSTNANSLMSEAFLQVSYNMLLKATNGFSSENLLGAGTFGSVFKGILEPYGKTVAVKVLNLQRQGASKSFMAECKALKNIRHRNLVGIVTACSSTDFQGNDFKALIYEFMPNGSLERWLHEVRNLTLVQRVDIAIDVASALNYLQHGCELPVLHCDLKPSNILLDDDMVAHVGDFGLAKFLSQHQNPNQSSSIGVRGTVGYAAPEYGLGGEVSTEGDIYSFGILLLEMTTGKRPTDNMFKEDLNLHMYAKAALPDPDQVLQIVDPFLTAENESDEAINERRATEARFHQKVECMVSMVKIGVACSNPSPQDRMKITDAISELRRAKGIISIAKRQRHYPRGSCS